MMEQQTMEQTFMTIHNLTTSANILFASDSIYDILGYQPNEVKGKSCFDFFHPDEVPFARSVHSRGVLLDKAAVLHYARILARDGQWVSCECCFTVVHDVLVACTSIYRRDDEKSKRRAIEAPQIRRLFSCSPLDPRYHMLEHLSPKFKMPPMEREPRAALILNRFTRSLNIMFATNAVSTILGLSPDEIKNKAFYECIQENCLQDAIQCLESAKANESIAYLRFWFRDPRTDDGYREDVGRYDGVGDEDMEDKQAVNNTIKGDFDESGSPLNDGVMDLDPVSPAKTEIELEAVVSCTSDGLVVVLRRARPPIPCPHPPLLPSIDYENGLFAAPWGLEPIRPYYPPELLYNFRPPLLPQYMPLRESVRAAGGAPLDQLMRSIRDVAVFAWALVGINGNIAAYGRGLPRGDAQPPDGLPVWDPRAANTSYRGLENQQALPWAQANGEEGGRENAGPSYSSVYPAVAAQAHRACPLPVADNYTYQAMWPGPQVPYGAGAVQMQHQQPPQLHQHRQQPSHVPAPQPNPQRQQQQQQQQRPPQAAFYGLPQEPWAEASAAQAYATSYAIPTTPTTQAQDGRDRTRFAWH